MAEQGRALAQQFLRRLKALEDSQKQQAEQINALQQHQSVQAQQAGTFLAGYEEIADTVQSLAVRIQGAESAIENLCEQLAAVKDRDRSIDIAIDDFRTEKANLQAVKKTVERLKVAQLSTLDEAEADLQRIIAKMRAMSAKVNALRQLDGRRSRVDGADLTGLLGNGNRRRHSDWQDVDV